MTSESFCDNTQLLSLLPLITKTVLAAAELRETGYTKSQLLILAALFRRNDLTMGKVAEFISSSKEQATRAVAPLVASGLLERYVDPENRTKIHIRLTDLGRKTLEQNNRHILHNLYQIFKERISDDEMLELKASAESMIRILSKVENG